MAVRSFFIIFLLALSCLNAADLPDHPLILSELIDIALKNNPNTRYAWWDAYRAAAAVGGAKSAYYPNVDLLLKANNGRDFKYLNGPDTSYTILGADITLSYILLDFGVTKADLQSTKSALLAAQWQNSWVIQKVILEVLKNTYTLLHSQKALEAALISYKEAETVFKASKELNIAGLVPVTDLYTSESLFIQMKMECVKQRSQVTIEKGRLATSLGLPVLTDIEIAPIEISTSPALYCISTLIDQAHQQRADLLKKRAQYDESLFIKNKIQASYRSKLSLKGSVGANHALHDRTNGAQYQIFLGWTTPIFNGFETSYQNRIAYANTKMNSESLAELELQIAQEILQNSCSLEVAKELLLLAEENLKSVTKAYNGVLEKYRVGKENIFDLSSSQRQLAQARLYYNEAETQLLVAIANLAYSTGTLGVNLKTGSKI
jgi:outer membrane protein